MEPDKLDNLASGLPAGDAESESTAEALSSGFVISAPVLARLDAEPEQHAIALKSDLLSGDRPEDSSESPWQWFPSSPVNFADSDGFGMYDTNDFPLFPQSNGMELFTPIQVVSGKSHSRDSSVDVTGPEDYEQAFDCSECSIVFGTQDELSSHDAMKHPGSNLNAWAYRPFFPATKSPACGLFESYDHYEGFEMDSPGFEIKAEPLTDSSIDKLKSFANDRSDLTGDPVAETQQSKGASTQAMTSRISTPPPLEVEQILGDRLKGPPLSETPRSDTSSSVTESYLDERKAKIVNEIVLFVTSKIKLGFALARNNGSEAPPSQGNGETSGLSNSLPQAMPKISTNSKKRKIADRDAENTDEEDDTSKKRGKKAVGVKEQDEAYACPYFKYNPAMYKSARNCPGPGWPNTHRVKEHLYRRHRQPKYRCGRCWQPFKDEASHLDHQRLPEPCPLRDIEHVEGFDASQERSLRSRKRANPDLSETEKWCEVYKILFPHVEHQDIPSPFYDYGELSAAAKGKEHRSNLDHLNECEEYLLREIPPRLRQALSRELEADLSVVEESLRWKATACVKTLIADAFRELREFASVARAGPSSAPPGEPEASGDFQQEDWFPEINLDFLDDAFTMLGDEEIGYDQGGLLDNILQASEDLQNNHQPGSAKKLSDSGYVSSSPDGSQQAGDAVSGNSGTW